MTASVNPDLMAPLADAGYTLISLHHWDTKAKCPRTGKLRIRGKSPIHRDWTKRPYRNADALAHAAMGGNVGVRLTTRNLVVDVDPRNLDGGRKAMLPALKGLGLSRLFPNRADWRRRIASLHGQTRSPFYCGRIA